jgi:hypothetical protein
VAGAGVVAGAGSALAFVIEIENSEAAMREKAMKE